MNRRVGVGLLGGWLACATCWGQPPTAAVLDSIGKLKSSDAQRTTYTKLKQTWDSHPSWPKDTTYIWLVVDLARVYQNEGQIPTSIALLKTLIQQVDRRDVQSSLNTDLLLKAYYRLMFCQEQTGQLIEARQTGQKGLMLAKPYAHSKWTSNLYGQMAYVLSTEGDYEQAVRMADRSIAIGRSIGHAYGVANGYFTQAKAFRELNKLEAGHQAINEAIRTLDAAVLADKMAYIDSDLPNYYDVKATLFYRQRHYAEAGHWFEKGIQAATSLQNPTALASIYNDYGFLLSKTGRYQSAIKLLNEAIALTPPPNNQAVALDNLGVIYQKQGQLMLAIQTFQRAMQTLMPTYRPQRLNHWPNAGELRMASNKEFLLPIFQNMAETWQLAAANPAYSKALHHARYTYQLADQLVDYMRWEHSGQQSKLYWREKTHELYEGAIETCFRLNDPAMAYQFMEKSRAVLLSDRLNELGARQQLPPELAQQEAELNQNISVLQNQLTNKKPGSANYQLLQTELLDAQTKADRFVQQMAKSHPLYFRYRYDNRVQPVRQVQQWLGERDQSLISYFVGDSALYVLGVTSSGQKLHRQPIALYQQYLQPWLGLLQNPVDLNPQYAQFLRQGHELYRLLLEPLHLPEGRVMVSPDGFFLPFEALSKTPTEPDFLVNHYAFSYVYSVNRALVANQPSQTNGGFLGMAPVQFNQTSAQASLPGSAESLQRVGSHFFMPTLLTGSVATRAQFRQLAPRASIVQLFTHADADTLHREPVLYFADSLLRMSELQTGPTFQTQLPNGCRKLTTGRRGV
jgi:tetratricopeptide (TPR) repeat protein